LGYVSMNIAKSAQEETGASGTLSRDLEDGSGLLQSAETYDELPTFVHGERGKMAGLPEKHDDRVMALSLANVVVKQGGSGDILFL
jgi:hypothetical protein